MLAGLLPPAIVGTTYDDVDASGSFSVGEQLVGVTVELARDDGDGLYDPADDPVIAGGASDDLGVYSFSELADAAKYFVVRPAQVVAGQTLAAVVSPLLEPSEPNLVIDHFRTTQIVRAIPPAGSADGSSQRFSDETEVIGAERDLYAELVEGSSVVTLLISTETESGQLEFEVLPETSARRTVTWDGLDGVSEAVGLGLAGRDLTGQGQNSGIVVQGHSMGTPSGVSASLRIYEGDVSNYSEASFVLPERLDGSNTWVFVPFESFVGAVAPSDVDAIQLVLPSTAESVVSGAIDSVAVFGSRRFDIAEVDVADLSLSKSNQVDVLATGQSITYQLTVSNAGPESVVGAEIIDTFPALLSDVRYTSSVAGAVEGHTTAGVGDLHDVVDMPVGSSITYTITATVNGNLGQVVNNEAQVVVPAGILDPDLSDNVASDSDTIGVVADLSVTQSDGVSTIAAGESVTYEIQVRNDGPSDVVGANFLASVPFGLMDASYTSTSTGNASGNTASGNGPIDDVLQLGAGATVTYLMTGRVAANASGVMTQTARIEGPDIGNWVETDPANNTLTDVNVVSPLTALGSDPTILWPGDPLSPGETDRFQITAHSTGLLTVTAHAPNAGLQLSIDDRYGNAMAGGEVIQPGRTIVVPVVSQETYFVRVINADGENVIGYDLEIENFLHNVPQVWGIDPASDSGWANNDADTAEPRPTILIQADLDDAIAAGIPVRLPDAAPGPGVAVEVMLTDLETGEQFVDYAAPIGSASDWFSYTPAASSPLSSGVYAVTAAVRTFDGAGLGGVSAPASGRTPQSAPFTLTVDRVAPIAADRPDMLSASDTGRSTVDQVTRTTQPAFRGNGEPLTQVRVYANRIGGEIEVIGRGMTGSDGSWEVTVEPLDDDIYHVRAEFEDRAGNVSSVGEPLLIEIDTRAPNTPLLDLLASHDSGLTQSDNITRMTSPSFSMTTQDPMQAAHWIRFNYNYRVYLRPDAGDGSASAAEILLYDSLQDTTIPLENLLEGLTDLEQLVRQLGPLPEGVHELKLEVEDRAGNISEDYLLTVAIDTTPPTTEFQLLPSSDSGGFADDAVTNVHQPAFAGRTEPGATVSLFANGQLVGRAQAGSDASDGVPGDGLAAWEITSEPMVDGEYGISVHIEDRAGNEAESDPLSVVIDTAAPNLPYLDLITDSGISDTDNITDTNTPVFTVTAGDRPEGGPNPFPHDIKYRLYDRPSAGGEILIVDSFAILGAFSEEGSFTFTSPLLADGVHNLKLEIEDRAGNVSLPFTLQIEIITSLPQIDQVDLADYSDSGMSDTDNVTGISQPAIIGVGSVGDTVLIRANGVLVGRGVVNSDASDGVLDNGLGAWEITLEPLDDDVYEIVASIEDAAGNVVNGSPLIIEIDTLEPNTPLLDLVEAYDLGRHNDDNITHAEEIVFSATAHDPNALNHLELFPDGQNFKFRIYLRGEQADEVLLYDSAVDPALTDLLDGLTAAAQILTPGLNLPEGQLSLKLEVEDRAGNISHDFLLDVLVDRTSFPGTVLLHPNSDSGVPGLPATFSDARTNVRTPWLIGTAEADSLVTVTIDTVAAGTAVAIPLDGDDAVQPPAPPYELQGNWLLQTAVALADGMHQVLVTFEDPAGNRATAEMSLTIDTAGPRIVNVTRNEPGFPSVFDPKPTSGPDPLIDSLVVHFTDLPIIADGTDSGSMAETLLAEEGNYQVAGDANGDIPVVNVEIDTNELTDGTVVTTATLLFSEPLPDDRFTLTVSDAIGDLVGNPLDGESGARAPFEGQPGQTGASPEFPSGDGVPGGSFVARFTVDSRPEIGTWAAGSAWIDINGNWRFDPENADFVNRDLVFRYGFASDDLIAGKFALPGQTTDGFDKLAAYGRAEGQFRWLVDTDNDGVPNIDRVEPQAVNGLPVAGRFDNHADNGDEVGLFNGTHWFFDTDHDFRTDTRLRSRLVGYPIVGDFDGDGFDDLATWADNRFMIDLAAGRLRGWDGLADHVFTFGFIGVRERPVAADMNQDGFDDLGLWVPDRSGVTDRDQSEWYFLISDGQSLIDRFSPPDDPLDSRPVIDFTPRPFGPDLYARFGDEFALPIVGNFDPPTIRSAAADDHGWTNPNNALDVNGDGAVSPLDALLIVNQLNAGGARALAAADRGRDMIDVDGDRHVSPLDALLVVNELNRINHLTTLVGQPRQPVSAVAAVAAVPEVAADLDALAETGSLIDAALADESLGADKLSLALATLDDALARRRKHSRF